MYATSQFSDSGFINPRPITNNAQLQLIRHGRCYVKEHHPLIVLIYGVFAISLTGWLALEIKAGNFSSPLAPLVSILALVCYAMLVAYAITLAKSVRGIGALLARDFVFSDQAQQLIAKRRAAKLPIRGIDLWRALVIHMRFNGDR